MRINVVKLIEDVIGEYIDVDISTGEALEIITQNFKENLEAGAPEQLIERIIRAVEIQLRDMKSMWNEYKGK